MKTRCVLIFLIIAYSISAFANSCPLDHHWVRAHFRRAYHRADGTFVSASNVTAHCKKNPPGYSFWRPKISDMLLAEWPHKAESHKKWSEEEIERIIEALGELPQVLWQDSMVSLHRMDKSQTAKDNPATSANKIIVIYDSAFTRSEPLAQVLAHEMAHERYRYFSPDVTKSYTEENAWFSISGLNSSKRWVVTRKNFVKSDGSESPEEDFANNVEYFLFNERKLKEVSPEAHDWIRRHFGDKLKLKGKP